MLISSISLTVFDLNIDSSTADGALGSAIPLSQGYILNRDGRILSLGAVDIAKLSELLFIWCLMLLKKGDDDYTPRMWRLRPS